MKSTQVALLALGGFVLVKAIPQKFTIDVPGLPEISGGGGFGGMLPEFNMPVNLGDINIPGMGGGGLDIAGALSGITSALAAATFMGGRGSGDGDGSIIDKVRDMFEDAAAAAKKATDETTDKIRENSEDMASKIKGMDPTERLKPLIYAGLGVAGAGVLAKVALPVAAKRATTKAAAKVTAAALQKTLPANLSKRAATKAAAKVTARAAGSRLAFRAIPGVGQALIVGDVAVTAYELITGKDVGGAWVGFGPEIASILGIRQKPKTLDVSMLTPKAVSMLYKGHIQGKLNLSGSELAGVEKYLTSWQKSNTQKAAPAQRSEAPSVGWTGRGSPVSAISTARQSYTMPDARAALSSLSPEPSGRGAFTPRETALTDEQRKLVSGARAMMAEKYIFNKD